MPIDDHVHVWPVDDHVDHLIKGPGANDGDCICGPITKPVPRESGRMGWMIIHVALDGREMWRPEGG